jgi:hypothetical protein
VPTRARPDLPQLLVRKIPPGFDFCGQCAATLQAGAGITKDIATASKPAAAVRFVVQEALPTLDGERKTVTALFADIAVR